MIIIGPIMLVIILPFMLSIPTFILLQKTLLKNNDLSKPGLTPKRTASLFILLTVHLVPTVILYDYLIDSVIGPLFA